MAFWHRMHTTALYAEESEFRRQLDGAMVLEVSEVHRYWVGSHSIGEAFYVCREVPTAAPLAPVMWLEWRADPAFGLGATHYGALLGVSWERGDEGAIDPDGSTRWLLRGHLFYLLDGRVTGWPQEQCVYAWVRDDGSLSSVRADGAKDAQGEGTMLGYIAEALLGIAFAHCKNVRILERGPSRQVLRRAARTGEPTVIVRTLVIDPLHVVVAHEQRRPHADPVAQRLHLVRGHFAEYTPERPLFGKYSGRFFIPLHTRGSLQAGAVVKDYEVRAGAD
jgi:hypothetical protein